MEPSSMRNKRNGFVSWSHFLSFFFCLFRDCCDCLLFVYIGQKFSDMVGSSYYIAPEVFRGEYSEGIDVWSSGVILYVLLCGFPPFGGPTQQAIFNSIQRGKLNFPPHLWDKISPSAKDLISNMLCPDPNSRFTVTQALSKPNISTSFFPLFPHSSLIGLD